MLAVRTTHRSQTPNNYALPEKCGGPSYRLYARSVDDNTTADDPLTPAELPAEQRQILNQSIEDQQYYECESPSEALASFEQQIHDQMERNNRETAYVFTEDELYRLEYCQLDECAG